MANHKKSNVFYAVCYGPNGTYACKFATNKQRTDFINLQGPDFCGKPTRHELDMIRKHDMIVMN